MTNQFSSPRGLLEGIGRLAVYSTILTLPLLQGTIYASPQDPAPGIASEVKEPATTAAPPAPWQFALSLDSLYSDNLSHPANGLNALRNFDSQSDAASLGAANFDLQYTQGKFGLHLDAGYGQAYETIGSADPWRGPNRYIGQLYVSYRPLKRNALQIDFGKFYTSAGAEVVDPVSNFNYSRSLLFVLGVPYYHFGLRATVPLTSSLTVGAQLVNGWNDVRDNNSGKTAGLTSAWTKSKWSWSQTYLGGPEKTDSNQGFRHLLDEVLTVSPKPWVQGYVEALGGFERSAPLNGILGRRDYWTGVAAALKFTPAKKISLSPRCEFYDDATGFTSGVAQHLTEFTGTFEYRPKPIVTSRLEYRADHSNEPFFQEGSRAKSSHLQQTVELAVIVNLKREH